MKDSQASLPLVPHVEEGEGGAAATPIATSLTSRSRWGGLPVGPSAAGGPALHTDSTASIATDALGSGGHTESVQCPADVLLGQVCQPQYSPSVVRMSRTPSVMLLI